MNSRLVSLRQQYEYLPKDFIETSSGHILALVHWGIEEGRLLASLRYRRGASGGLEKLTTTTAQKELEGNAPHWLFRCPRRHTQLTGVPVQEVVSHLRPENDWLESSNSAEIAELSDVLGLSSKQAGVTGSFLVGANRSDSDIDLVVYGSEVMQSVRTSIRRLQNRDAASPLSESQWKETYSRRGCSLTFEEYCWHERRKFNKVMFKGRRVDVSCVSDPPGFLSHAFSKLGKQTLEATVTDDTRAFDMPAVYQIDHPTIDRIVCFTPTYAGQAVVGERVVASGWLEEDSRQQQQLLIGTSREASGEYLKVELGH
ncbi:MAG: DNA polymerase subunit beta [Aureliella sp.]